MKKEKIAKKDSKGLTLIVLVITIIVLIILAGAVINLTLSENGVLNKAKQAKNNYIQAVNEEQKDINQMYGQLLVATNDNATVTVSVKELKELVAEECKKNKTTETVLWSGIAKEKGTYKFIDDSYDVNNYDVIRIEYYTSNGTTRTSNDSTTISVRNITKGAQYDVLCHSIGMRYSSLNFIDNGFSVDEMNPLSGYYVYISTIIGIKY